MNNRRGLFSQKERRVQKPMGEDIAALERNNNMLPLEVPFLYFLNTFSILMIKGMGGSIHSVISFNSL